MSLGNTRTAYGWIAIALHWITAASMVALWYTGENFENAVGRPARILAYGQHVSVGMVLFAFLAAKLVSSFAQPKPEPLERNKWLQLAAKLVQWAFLALIAVLIVTGPLAIWFNGRPINVFDLVQIPSPLPRNHDLHEVSEWVHKRAEGLFLPLLALHVLGALKHIVFDRDATLQRILWVKR